MNYIPEDWTVSDSLREWCHAKGWSDPLIDSVAEEFRDYWLARGDARAKKRNWDAAFRTWCRKTHVTPGQDIHMAPGAGPRLVVDNNVSRSMRALKDV